MEELIYKMKELDQLELPNGATGAVWLDDVIGVIIEYYTTDHEQSNETKN